ncbi:MAG: YHS domain-containing protein [Acidobacteria bacterium]|nr:MAG: YHS domain-containing protein [Acidobacteriota bacterium]
MTRRFVLRALAASVVASGLVAARSAFAGQEAQQPEKVKDVVCGMQIDPAKAKGGKSEYKGKTYYFCSEDCKKKFDKEPAKYVPDPKK